MRKARQTGAALATKATATTTTDGRSTALRLVADTPNNRLRSSCPRMSASTAPHTAPSSAQASAADLDVFATVFQIN